MRLTGHAHMRGMNGPAPTALGATPPVRARQRPTGCTARWVEREQLSHPPVLRGGGDVGYRKMCGHCPAQVRAQSSWPVVTDTAAYEGYVIFCRSHGQGPNTQRQAQRRKYVRRRCGLSQPQMRPAEGTGQARARSRQKSSQFTSATCIGEHRWIGTHM